MATKARVSFDETHGLYHRFLGMDAHRRKPHFWLGSDERQAKQRAERLELLWSQVEADWEQLPSEYPNWLETAIVKKPERPLWDDITLAVAKAIAKGGVTFTLPRNPIWSPYHYTLQIARMQRRFGAFCDTWCSHSAISPSVWFARSRCLSEVRGVFRNSSPRRA